VNTAFVLPVTCGPTKMPDEIPDGESSTAAKVKQARDHEKRKRPQQRLDERRGCAE
jgi:hypothetical protein